MSDISNDLQNYIKSFEKNHEILIEVNYINKKYSFIWLNFLFIKINFKVFYRLSSSRNWTKNKSLRKIQ